MGRDASTGLAKLKIDAKHTPRLLLGNSDDLLLGEWMLSVGFPLSLQITVTAGIVSSADNQPHFRFRTAKDGKTANISFIQTDAVMKTGHSGGALVNTKGELVGIDTGIISPNGTYAVYSFSVPINVVQLAVKEIIEKSGFHKG